MLLLAPQVVLEEKSMLFFWSFILKEQNAEQCWISALGLHCQGAAIAMGTSRGWKQVP